MIPRRTFLASTSAFTVATALAGWRNEPEIPRARVGLLTDTHITDNPDSCRLVGEAFRLFRREKVDTVLHAGDLADVWSPAGYREYRRLFHSAFGGRSPRELFSFGQHDAVRFPIPLKPGEKWYDVVWPAFTRAMETDQPYQLTTTLGGFPLIVFPQKWVEREYDQLLELVDRAVREHPNGPVFVLRHMPIVGTTVRSDAFDAALGDVQRMSRYPNVIMLTGHAHEDLHDERALWQGEFTAVGLGTLQWPMLQNVGCPVGIYVQNVIVTMELYSSRAEFVRWNLATGESVGERWIVHWGLIPKFLEREHVGRANVWDVFPMVRVQPLSRKKTVDARFGFPRLLTTPQSTVTRCARKSADRLWPSSAYEDPGMRKSRIAKRQRHRLQREFSVRAKTSRFASCRLRFGAGSVLRCRVRGGCHRHCPARPRRGLEHLLRSVPSAIRSDFELALVQRDGKVWGRTVDIGPDVCQVRIPFESFASYYGCWSGVPPIAKGECPDLRRLDHLVFTYGAWLCPGAVGRRHGFVVESVKVVQ